MTRVGWSTTVVTAVVALVIGFGAGWFGHDLASAPPSPVLAQEPGEDASERPTSGFEAVSVGLDQTHEFADGLTIGLSGFERGVEEGGVDPTTGEEGDLSYLSWRVELANEGDQTVQTGSVTRSCSVGDPPRESGTPALGAGVNPPESLGPGRSGSWDEDCWAEEDDTHLQYTVEFHDQDFVPLYPPVTFTGTVD
ncbi:hypothetical protein [Nocardiopsis alkaliphila]|uniref:hypothetical protein n=1 Tax=Nocardiopsis alkaliphila TaxID=225762 RepID=UPI000348DA6E|nr:hypothetical protein [Nocardiopsis alkaliphila]